MPLECQEVTWIRYINVHGPHEGARLPPDDELATEYLDGFVITRCEFFMNRYAGNLSRVVTSDHGRKQCPNVSVSLPTLHQHSG